MLKGSAVLSCRMGDGVWVDLAGSGFMLYSLIHLLSFCISLVLLFFFHLLLLNFPLELAWRWSSQAAAAALYPP